MGLAFNYITHIADMFSDSIKSDGYSEINCDHIPLCVYNKKFKDAHNHYVTLTLECRQFRKDNIEIPFKELKVTKYSGNRKVYETSLGRYYNIDWDYFTVDPTEAYNAIKTRSSRYIQHINNKYKLNFLHIYKFTDDLIIWLKSLVGNRLGIDTEYISSIEDVYFRYGKDRTLVIVFKRDGFNYTQSVEFKPEQLASK